MRFICEFSKDGINGVIGVMVGSESALPKLDAAAACFEITGADYCTVSPIDEA